MPKVKIAIIGAGIIGVSAGLRLLQTMPDAEVTIFTEKISPATTGDVAAGFWTPIYLSNSKPEMTDPWAYETYRFLQSVAAADPRPMHTGVFYCPGYQLFKSADIPAPESWSHIPCGFRPISKSELAMFPSDIKGGYYYVSVMCEGRKILPYLMNQFQQRGGKILVNFLVKSFDQLKENGYSVIVNCSGLGAKQLCNDDKVMPIRGQVMRVKAPWMNFFMVDDTGAYCLPNTDTVVIGGVSQKDNYNMAVSPSDRDSILSRVYALWPALKSAPILEDAVGLRPGRDSVRVEREVQSDAVIYHNYGHGGSGLTLFWGCAGDVVKMVMEDLKSAAKL